MNQKSAVIMNQNRGVIMPRARVSLRCQECGAVAYQNRHTPYGPIIEHRPPCFRPTELVTDLNEDGVVVPIDSHVLRYALRFMFQPTTWPAMWKDIDIYTAYQILDDAMPMIGCVVLPTEDQMNKWGWLVEDLQIPPLAKANIPR